MDFSRQLCSRQSETARTDSKMALESFPVIQQGCSYMVAPWVGDLDRTHTSVPSRLKQPDHADMQPVSKKVCAGILYHYPLSSNVSSIIHNTNKLQIWIFLPINLHTDVYINYMTV